MVHRRNRYRVMERYITFALLGALALFLLYLLFAALSITPMKITFAIITILVSALTLVYLFITHELLRKRSLWMSTGAAALLLCTLISLILHYPG